MLGGVKHGPQELPVLSYEPRLGAAPAPRNPAAFRGRARGARAGRERADAVWGWGQQPPAAESPSSTSPGDGDAAAFPGARQDFKSRVWIK